MVLESKEVRALVAEGVGSYILTFTVGVHVIAGSAAWAATSIACTLMILVYTLGGISGGHFNPAVSIAVGLTKHLEWKMVAMYCFVQIIFAIFGALTYGLIFQKVFAVGPFPDHEWYDAFGCEALYTFMLVTAVLNCACSAKNNNPANPNQFFGLAIGFTLVAGCYACGSISGGVFNPAVGIALDLVSVRFGYGWSLVYAAGEILGGLLAAGYFHITRPDHFDSRKAEELANGQDYGVVPKLSAEFIGTFFISLTVGLNVLGESPAPAWSIAGALVSMIYSFGDVSGGHFNPAVTVAVTIYQHHAGNAKLEAVQALMYIGVQFFGGVAGAFAFAGLHGMKSFPVSGGEEYNWAQTVLAELFFTFLLCSAVCRVVEAGATMRAVFGFVIAAAVTVGGTAVGAISGGFLNPAVALGVGITHVTNDGSITNCIVYIFVELASGVLAAIHLMALKDPKPDQNKKDLPPAK
eukprot:gnl/TRDRNA2_/TRDRNA2_185909_c0_seq1.p1 gnl/TRDRNA2_/TRDRNA2_185909_c0~~gnl/TRDRNA2_/TRDRNA2_185909_c0_seq1.p1  ORF type:complete len:466 (+),score=79.51 gnl/TRDRNA2_/TRDRNA2_185909_c0_seq1:177-1574(+)